MTELTIATDGSFEGGYHDSNNGDNDDKYPHGTEYYSNFSGSFYVKEKIDDYTYVLSRSNLEYEDEMDKVEYVDGVRYISTDALGVSDDTEFIFCLPGKPRSELSENVLYWDLNYIYGDNKTENLTSYCIYGVESESAFYSGQ